jgi:hypothetical protein
MLHNPLLISRADLTSLVKLLKKLNLPTDQYLGAEELTESDYDQVSWPADIKVHDSSAAGLWRMATSKFATPEDNLFGVLGEYGHTFSDPAKAFWLRTNVPGYADLERKLQELISEYMKG